MVLKLPIPVSSVALLKRQGLNVKGLVKAAPVKEEPLPYIDCTGNLQVLLSILYLNFNSHILKAVIKQLLTNFGW